MSAPDLDLLARFVELLVRSAGGRGGPPTLLQLRAGAAGLELAVAAVDDVHPGLECLLVPPEWQGVGVLVAGRAWSVEPGGPAGSPMLVGAGEVVGTAVSALVVWRDGTTVSALSIDGGEPRVQVEPPDLDDPHRCVGRLVDMLRRSLGLPTPPPGFRVDQLTTRLWLHRLLSAAAAGGALGPEAVEALEPPLPATWAACREQCALGGWPEIGVPPEVAAWMDEGVFAREALASFPDPFDALVDLAELLPRGTWVRLVEKVLAGGGPREASDSESS
jgi:hypothetical protein